QGILTPSEDIFVQPCPGRHQGTQGKLILCAWRGGFLHHRFECSGGQESIADLIALHDLEGAARSKLASCADKGLTEIKRRQQGVHDAARRVPVGWAPKHIACLRKPVLRGYES